MNNSPLKTENVYLGGGEKERMMVNGENDA